MLTYTDEWQESVRRPESFWLDASREVSWARNPSRALLTDGEESWRWFPDGRLNMSVNCLDRHVEAGRGDNVAIHYDSAMTSQRVSYTYEQLRDRVARAAGALLNLGVQPGDRVLIYLPMIPEAAIAMLACARIGAVHTVVFGGFASRELASRIRDAAPVVLITATGGIEPGRLVEYLPIVREALISAPDIVRDAIVLSRPDISGRATDLADSGVVPHDWDDLVSQAQPARPVVVEATHPLYVLYTSGTTGNPKGIIRDTGGYAVALTWSMKNIYDIGAGDTMFTASDVGWVVGHSYIVYGPLLAGATTVLYEGKPVGTPDAGAFWRIVDEYDVKTMFTAPTALRAIRRVDPDLDRLREYDISTLQTLFLAGERLDPETLLWARDGLGVPVIDHWWQTETGWPICAVPRGRQDMEVKPGSTAIPMPGYEVAILDGSGNQIDSPNVEGNIALRLPLPPGTLQGIWGGGERFRESYLNAFPGYYATGDGGYLDEEGYLFVMGRTDDVLNVAGHRISTGSIEEVLTMHSAIAECAVVGVHDHIKGQRAVGFVTLKAHASVSESDLEDQLVSLVRKHVGPVAAFRDVIIVDRLPKTRSGKVLRRTMRQIHDGAAHDVPATIEDPSTLLDLTETLRVRRERDAREVPPQAPPA